jgi:hypothetical protein
MCVLVFSKFFLAQNTIVYAMVAAVGTPCLFPFLCRRRRHRHALLGQIFGQGTTSCFAGGRLDGQIPSKDI